MRRTGQQKVRRVWGVLSPRCRVVAAGRFSWKVWLAWLPMIWVRASDYVPAKRRCWSAQDFGRSAGLADHEGGLRKDPFSDALGEEYVDILFHAAREAAPDALLENDRIVAERYTRAFKFLCDLKRIREITFFAAIDGRNTVETGSFGIEPYSKARPGILNRDWTRKPVYQALVETVAKSKPKT